MYIEVTTIPKLLFTPIRDGNLDILLEVIHDNHLNIDHSNSLGMTSMHIATTYGQKHIVNKLLELGADINRSDNMGYTPLHRAAIVGKLELFKLLLDRGANPALVDKTGKLPHHCVVSDDIKHDFELLVPQELRVDPPSPPIEFELFLGHCKI